MPKSALITEEPDLETLFNNAVEEISEQLEGENYGADYGFQSEWGDNEFDEEELELQATTLLFDSINSFPHYEENIERFCLPLFAKAYSDHAIDHVMDAFKKRPSMSQIYSAYLARFLEEEKVREFLVEILKDSLLLDWQKMWVIAALLQHKDSDDGAVKVALAILKDASRHDVLRGAAAIFVGRYGSHARRKNLITVYKTVTSYVQAAIYYSSRGWPKVERSNAKASWGGHGELNGLITIAMSK